MSAPYKRLAELATAAGYPETEFTEAERKLFGSLANGEIVACGGIADEQQRVIRDELFR